MRCSSELYCSATIEFRSSYWLNALMLKPEEQALWFHLKGTQVNKYG